MSVEYRCLTCGTEGQTDARACIAAKHVVHVWDHDAAEWRPTEKLPFGSIESWHVPQVARRDDGQWGVFCAACSHKAGEYVYACVEFEQCVWPPITLQVTDIDAIALWCVKCWTEAGPKSRPWQHYPAVVVSQGTALCEKHARATPDAVWG